eukprot:PhF_6_TR26213/c0_g1_i1/m.37360
MDLVNNLSESDFESLASQFSQRYIEKNRFINLMQSFLTPFMESGRIPKDTKWASEVELTRIHMEADEGNKGYITWSEFTSFLITSAKQDFESFGNVVEDGAHGLGFVRHRYLSNVRFPNQSEDIRKVIFLPRMKRYIVCGTNQNLTVHDEQTFECVSSMKLKGVMLDACFVSRSQMLVVATLDQSLNFYDIGTSDKRHAQKVIGSSFAPHHPVGDDNDPDLNKLIPRRLITFDKAQTRVIYDDKSHTVLASDRLGNVSIIGVDAIRICPTEMRTVPVASNVLISHLLRWHSSALTGMLLIDGSIVSCSTDNSIRLHDRARPWIETRAYMNAHKNVVRGIAYNSQYDFLASIGDDPTPTCWVVSLPRTSFTFRDDNDPHRHPVLGIYSLADSPYLVTGDADATFKVWDVRTFRCVQHIPYPAHASGGPSMESFTFAESSGRLVGPGKRLVVLEYTAPELKTSTHNTIVRGVLYLKDQVVTWSTEDVKSWNIIDGSAIRIIRPELSEGEEISAVCLDETGYRCFVGTSYGALSSMLFSSGTIQQTFPKQRGEITHLSYLPSVGSRRYKVICVGTAPCTVRWLYESDGSCLCEHSITHPHHQSHLNVEEIDVHQNYTHQKMIVNRDDGVILLIDASLATAPLLTSWRHGLAIVSMVSMDDVNLIAMADTHGTIHLRCQDTLINLGNLPEQNLRYTALHYYVDTNLRMLIGGCLDGTIVVWDLWNVGGKTKIPTQFWQLSKFTTVAQNTDKHPIAGIAYVPAQGASVSDVILVRYFSRNTVDVYTVSGTHCGALSESRLSLTNSNAKIENAHLPFYGIPEPADMHAYSNLASVSQTFCVTTRRPSGAAQPVLELPKVNNKYDGLTEDEILKLRRRKQRHRAKQSRNERREKYKRMWIETIPSFLKDLIRASDQGRLPPNTTNAKNTGENHDENHGSLNQSVLWNTLRAVKGIRDHPSGFYQGGEQAGFSLPLITPHAPKRGRDHRQRPRHTVQITGGSMGGVVHK